MRGGVDLFSTCMTSTTLSWLLAASKWVLEHGGVHAVDGGRGVVDVDVGGRGAGLERMEVGGLVVGDADEMHAVFGDVELVVAAGVGFSVGRLLHGLREMDEDDVVAGGGLAGGLVGDGAGDGGRGEGGDAADSESKGGETAVKVGHTARIRQGERSVDVLVRKRAFNAEVAEVSQRSRRGAVAGRFGQCR